MEVEDAAYFTDGFGVIPGDRIRIGTDASSTVVAVDYSAQVLTLDGPVTWRQGDPVNLDYAGNAPDIGAHESGFAAGGVPKPPMMLDE